MENFSKTQKHRQQNKKITSGTIIINDSESSKLIRIIKKKFVFKFRLSTKEIIKNIDIKLDKIIKFETKIFLKMYLAIIICFPYSKLEKYQ